MQGSQLIYTTNELLSALHITRSEAVKLNSKVTICSSSDGKSCSGSTDWSNGWIVFVYAKDDQAGTEEECATIDTDCLLRVQEAVSDDQLTVTGVDSNKSAIKSFTFSARGLPTISKVSRSGTFSVCSFDESDNLINSRAVVLSLSGRVRVSENAAVITCPSSP